jgi:hypothetical protein
MRAVAVSMCAVALAAADQPARDVTVTLELLDRYLAEYEPQLSALVIS